MRRSALLAPIRLALACVLALACGGEVDGNDPESAAAASPAADVAAEPTEAKPGPPTPAADAEPAEVERSGRDQAELECVAKVRKGRSGIVRANELEACMKERGY